MPQRDKFQRPSQLARTHQTKYTPRCVFLYGGSGSARSHVQNTILLLFVCPPISFIGIALIFSRDHCKSQGKMETMFMQDFGEQTKSTIVFLKVAYGK